MGLPQLSLPQLMVGRSAISTHTLSPGGGYLPESVEFFARAAATGQALTAPAKLRYDNLIRLYFATGIWDTRDAAYAPFLAETSAQALLNLVSSSFPLVAVSSPTWTEGLGLSFAGGYYTTGFNPATAGGNVAQDDVSIRAFVTEQAADGANSANASIAGNTNLRLIPKNSANNFQHRANSASTQGNVAAVGVGLYSVSRSASDQYFGYVSAAEATLAFASTAMTSAVIQVGTINSGTAKSLDTLGLLDFGGAVTAEQEAQFWGGID